MLATGFAAALVRFGRPFMASKVARPEDRNLAIVDEMITDRVTYMLEQCAERRVLHLGCTDWPFTERKLAGGALPHAKLKAVAASLVGVDADAAGVAHFQQNGFPETYLGNVEHVENPEVVRRSYDVILAGEIIEHPENPGTFLRSIQTLMTDRRNSAGEGDT